MAEQRMDGIGASAGIRFGKALLYQIGSQQEETVRETIAADQVAAEIDRLQSAKAKSLAGLDELVEKTKQTLGESKAIILAGQQSFLADPIFYPEMEKLVTDQKLSAEKAVGQVVNHFASVFERMPQDYMKERAADVKDVGKRLLSHLSGKQGVQLSEIEEEVILVADDLTPSDTVQLDKDKVLAIITRIGGKTSHTAILAKSLGIPAVLGVGDAVEAIRNGTPLIVDGEAGLCILQPDEATHEEYLLKWEEEEEQQRFLLEFAHQPARTVDGFTIEVAANIGTAAEAKLAAESGAEGVGLFRTEFLFMNANEMPSEEAQFAAYREVAEHLNGKPVIIRTLDIGGDKELSYLSLPKEMNPFLGYRAIRLCLDQQEILVTQLRAIVRASHYGKLKIMFPMVASLEEWREAKALLEQVQAELRAQGVPFDEEMEVGIMVEVPSTAMLADLFAKEVDFFSIGTNDLVQYTLAVDRMNEKVAYLYDYFHPAVVRMVKQVIEAAHREGKWAGMCGGMAGDPLAAPLLLGLGLDEWSMDAGSMKKVKYAVSKLSKADCEQLVPAVLQAGTAADVRKVLTCSL
ncbi:MAG: phosphoenolpyruvate--protein phosphotransferase [Tumebacillaceae bacterium]